MKVIGKKQSVQTGMDETLQQFIYKEKNYLIKWFELS